MVRSTSIDKMTSEEIDPTEKPILSVKFENGVYIEVVQDYKFDWVQSAKDPNTSEQEFTDLRFTIPAYNKVCSASISLKDWVDGEEVFPEITPIDKATLEKEGFVISYANLPAGSEFLMSLDRLSWVFKRNGTIILTRAHTNKGPFEDIGVVPTTGEEPKGYTEEELEWIRKNRNIGNILNRGGSWEVYLESYASELGRYIRVSEVLSWKQ